jgi:hypothetical protein
MLVETSQLLRRLNQPVIVSGSYRVATLTCPNALLDSAPSSHPRLGYEQPNEYCGI